MNPFIVIIGIGLALGASRARADFYHYSDILIGDQAAGMGGAYTAIADDASALYYNPAGLAYANGNAVSASMNAYHGSRTLVRGLFDEDYHRRSGQIVPVFLGGTSKSYLPGEWTLSYGLYVPNSRSTSRDETIRDDETNRIKRWHHMLKAEETATYAGAAAGRAFGDTAFGVGLTLLQVQRLILQTINGRYGPFSSEGEPDVYFNQMTTVREELSVMAIEPSIGVLQTSGVWRIAANVRQAHIFQQSGKRSVDNYELVTRTDADQPIGDPAFDRDETEERDDAPLRQWPAEVRLGVARRLPTWDWSADLSYRSVGQKPGEAYRRRHVANLALGARTAGGQNNHAFGIFTNADARPTVDRHSASGSEHVNFLGMTYGLFHATDTKSRYALTLMIQLGKGKGQFDGRPGREPQEILTQSFGIGGAIATGS